MGRISSLGPTLFPFWPTPAHISFWPKSSPSPAHLGLYSTVPFRPQPKPTRADPFLSLHAPKPSASLRHLCFSLCGQADRASVAASFSLVVSAGGTKPATHVRFFLPGATRTLESELFTRAAPPALPSQSPHPGLFKGTPLRQNVRIIHLHRNPEELVPISSQPRRILQGPSAAEASSPPEFAAFSAPPLKLLPELDSQ